MKESTTGVLERIYANLKVEEKFRRPRKRRKGRSQRGSDVLASSENSTLPSTHADKLFNLHEKEPKKRIKQLVREQHLN